MHAVTIAPARPARRPIVTITETARSNLAASALLYVRVTTPPAHPDPAVTAVLLSVADAVLAAPRRARAASRVSARKTFLREHDEAVAELAALWLEREASPSARRAKPTTTRSRHAHA